MLAALLAWGGAARAQVPVLTLRDAGPGRGPQILAAALAGRHSAIAPASVPYLVPRDSTVTGTLIVLARDAVIEGTVRGDVIVVGGDLVTHPGAEISGRATTYGGGVYESALAHIGGGHTSFRNFTYDVTPTADGYALSYRVLAVRSRSIVDWAGPLGFAIPTYDRTNGLSVPVAATVAVPRTTVEFEPRLTYRSQLGRLDPSMAMDVDFTRTTSVHLSGGRSTYTNDAWIRPDLSNSVDVLLLGDDMRNYYRATRVDGALSHRWEFATGQIEPYLGGRWERASTVRPDSDALGGPWSIFGRHDLDDMLRPNPAIDDGDIGSFVAGTSLDWSDQGIVARARIDAEVGESSRMVFVPDHSWFGQATLGGEIAFPTFGTQSLRLEAHGVFTSRGTTPRQRWAFLGGPGSLPTLDPLEQGGDQLLFVAGGYNFPIQRISLPFVGSPVVTLRDMIGSAGVGTLPQLEQALGVRLSVSHLYAELLVDPANRHTATGIGFTLAR